MIKQSILLGSIRNKCILVLVLWNIEYHQVGSMMMQKVHPYNCTLHEFKDTSLLLGLDRQTLWFRESHWHWYFSCGIGEIACVSSQHWSDQPCISAALKGKVESFFPYDMRQTFQCCSCEPWYFQTALWLQQQCSESHISLGRYKM